MLHDTIGVRFSDLENNWEECRCFYDFSADGNDRHNLVYRRCGDLPDGRHFGAAIWPKSQTWPPHLIIQIVDQAGQMHESTEAGPVSWDRQVRWPMAVAASP